MQSLKRKQGYSVLLFMIVDFLELWSVNRSQRPQRAQLCLSQSSDPVISKRSEGRSRRRVRSCLSLSNSQMLMALHPRNWRGAGHLGCCRLPTPLLRDRRPRQVAQYA